MSYRVFIRSWWKENPAWPNGLEPEAGEKTYLAKGIASEEQARELAMLWNATHEPGRLSLKAEYESESGSRLALGRTFLHDAARGLLERKDEGTLGAGNTQRQREAYLGRAAEGVNREHDRQDVKDDQAGRPREI